MKGGYKIIDLKGVSLTSGTQATIPGASEAVQNPYRKNTVVSGLVVGTDVYPDFNAVFTEDSGTFTAGVNIGGNTVDIVISTGDKVTVTVTEPETVSPSVETRKSVKK